MNETIEDLLKKSIEAVKIWVSKIAQQLFQVSIATFGNEKSTVYVCFCQTLVNVISVVAENPSKWLSVKDNLEKLFYHFLLVLNEKLEYRLFASTTQDAFTALISAQIVDHFFL